MAMMIFIILTVLVMFTAFLALSDGEFGVSFFFSVIASVLFVITTDIYITERTLSITRDLIEHKPIYNLECKTTSNIIVQDLKHISCAYSFVDTNNIITDYTITYNRLGSNITDIKIMEAK